MAKVFVLSFQMLWLGESFFIGRISWSESDLTGSCRPTSATGEPQVAI